jgi:two-component system response regulator VicR
MNSVKVLYVEDEPFLAKIVKESLESRGFHVRHVADGKEVMPVFEQYQPDICVLDVMLPHRDGFSIGQDIRGLHSRIPIIYLTAKSQTEDVLQGFGAGGNDYIRKPFSVEELIVRIQNLLAFSDDSQSNLGSRDIVPLGKFTFDLNKYELAIGKKITRLSHREAELLKILAENQNFTIQRKEILKRVWGDDSFFNSRNLDVYIKKLRDILSADPGIEIITLKGVGYHFAVGQKGRAK